MGSFNSFSGMAAMAAGVFALLYSVAFVVISRTDPVMGGTLAALFLLLQGVLATAAWTGLYQKLREVDAGFAAWIILLATFGLVGAAVHGGYDLANAINVPASANPDLPSQIDPRGLLTFGFTGLALLLGSWLLSRERKFPMNFVYLGYLGGLLSLVLYLGRLTVLSATSPVILIPALVNGFIVGPVWYFWLGRLLSGKK